MPKILIADDESNILMLTELLFKDMGMDVITAENGEEAIQKALENKPDLIVTDVVMPKKNGFEVCHAVRNNPDTADTPIIILSALGDEFNKITGFEEGADDYITKPFNIEELKSRSKVLLFRNKTKKAEQDQSVVTTEIQHKDKTATLDVDIKLVSTGLEALDNNLFGGLPIGSNILVLGPVGSGKSSFVRNFIAQGLSNNEKSLFVAVDDNPFKIRQELSTLIPAPAKEYENIDLLRFVDAYSWSTLSTPVDEPFAINGLLELNQLSGVISDASFELGQTVQQKQGGRRAIDSISSLVVNFELPAAQRFLTQIARTSTSFGDVTTLFIVEAGTIPDIALNNIKYLLDGVLEFEKKDGNYAVRASSMKWTRYSSDWVYH
jgi:CheY-like chemotaxis protein